MLNIYNGSSIVDIYAPGLGITSAWIGSKDASKMVSGTSQAAPHVAGAVALHICKYSPEYVFQSMSKVFIEAGGGNASPQFVAAMLKIRCKTSTEGLRILQVSSR